MSTSTPQAGQLPEIFRGRLNIHVLVISLALIVVITNVVLDRGVISSDQLVGRTKLSRLVTNGSFDTDQLIEDYPNLDLASLSRQLATRKGILSVPQSIFTKENAVAVEQTTPTERTDTVAYTIQTGDTIGRIARHFGVSINTILWENNLTATSLIKPGDQLSILPSSGISHTVAKGQTLGQIARLYGVSEDEILKANSLSNPNQITIGTKLVIPGGSRLAAAPTPVTPIQSTAGQVARSIKQIIGGKSSAIIPAGGKMVWPTVGYNITQYYSWVHTGVDIANHIGTPVYAAEAGVVSIAGWNSGGYGNQIVLSHGNGLQTRYGHLSAFAVTVGQKVSKGQYIAAMGSTGHSTGPHLHFEVMINGQRYNPLNYIR